MKKNCVHVYEEIDNRPQPTTGKLPPSPLVLKEKCIYCGEVRES